LAPLLVRAPPAEAARALAEAALGDEHRRLTASRELAVLSDPLAQRAAERLATELPDRPIAEGLAPSGAGRWLLAGAAGLAVMLAAGALVGGLLPALLPRLYDPLGDHPPWARTRLAWAEVPALARPGETLRVVIRADGPALAQLRLRGAAEGLGFPVDVPMVLLGDGRWGATLTPLPVPQGADPALVLWAESHATRSRRSRIAIDPAPVLARLDAELAQPDYTRLAPEKQSAAAARPAAFAALPGAVLTLRPHANRRLRALALRAADGTSRRLELRDGAAVLTDPSPGAYTVAGEAEDGRVGPALDALRLTRRVDQPPEVSIDQPEIDGVATPNAIVPLVITARDDLGLASVVRWTVSNDQTREETVETVGGTSDTVRCQVRLGDVAPGSEVRIGAAARDTRPPDGQLSAAVERRLRIVPLAVWNELVRDQLASDALLRRYQPMLEQLAKAHADLAAAATAGAQPGDERLQQVQAAAAAIRAQVEGMRTPEPLFAAEPDLQEAIAQMTRQLEAEARAARAPADPAAAEQLRRDLEELTARAEAQALAEALHELADAQEALAREAEDLAAQPQSDGVKARLRALAERQEAVEEVLDAWREQARTTAGRAETRAPELAQRLRKLADGDDAAEAGSASGDAARSARAGRNERTAPPARRAAAALRRMAGRAPESGTCRNGWCDKDGLSRCTGQLARLARLGLGLGGSPGGSGGGGALGMAGGNLYAQQGGNALGVELPLFGPETLSTRRSSRNRPGNDRNGRGPGVAIGADGRMLPATGYVRGVRTTTADPGATLGPDEQRTVDDYHRRLGGDALSPATPEVP
jgi:vacuolar-type H+-ATPase subunit E/Vma4